MRDRFLHHGRPRHGLSAMLAIALIATTVGTFLLGGTSVVRAAEVGSRGPSFAASSAPSAPTAEKPQSKLWFNDGAWWGSLFNAATRRFEIHRPDASSNAWLPSSASSPSAGTVIAERHTVRMDCLWDGTHLYVASAVRPGVSTSDTGVRVLRYSYDPATRTYALDAGYPVAIASAKVEAVVLDKDATGTLW